MDLQASTSSACQDTNSNNFVYIDYRGPSKELKPKEQNSDEDSETNKKDDGDIKNRVHHISNISKYAEFFPRTFLNFIKWETPVPYYPEHFMKPNDDIEHKWISRYKDVGDYIEIIVSEFLNPSKFWVHLAGDNNHDALNALINEMKVFYKKHGKSLQITKDCICVGLYVAGIFLDEFLRAQILEDVVDDKLKVLYIDFGIEEIVPIKDIYFLYRKFIWLPTQAIRARLHNVIPKDNSAVWSLEASMYMIGLVYKKKLYGQIVKINKTEKCLDIIMIDTTTSDDNIHINNELIKYNHAAIGNNEKLKSDKQGPKNRIHFSKIDAKRRRRLTCLI